MSILKFETPHSLKRNSFSSEIMKHFPLYIFVVPGVIWFLIFCYQPMYGILIAFKQYDIGRGVFASPWVGFKNFLDFFNDYNFSTIMKNTLGISMLKLVFAFPAPIILALLLNEVRGRLFKRVIQTISYLPYFVSWVVIAGIWYELFSVDEGSPINTLLMNLHLIKEPIFWFGDPKYFWGFAVISDIWKNVGFNTILYIAALAAVSVEMYEAATVDGAGKLRQIWHITLPSIRPTILLLFIFGVGNLLNAGFDQIFVLQNPAVADASEIIDTYVVKIGIFQANYEIATAIGIFKSIIGIILLFSTNFIIKLCGEDGIF